MLDIFLNCDYRMYTVNIIYILHFCMCVCVVYILHLSKYKTRVFHISASEKWVT